MKPRGGYQPRIPMSIKRQVMRLLHMEYRNHDEIAEQAGVSPATVSRIKQTAGIDTERVTLKRDIITLARRGDIHPSEIAAELGCSTEYVYDVCEDHDLLTQRHPVTGQWFY